MSFISGRLNDAALLTDDERVVLKIAYEGGLFAPIGRWEKPVLQLTQRGLLVRFDTHGYRISRAGRTLQEAQHGEGGGSLFEECARNLVAIGRRAAHPCGGDVEDAVRRCGEAIILRAVEILREAECGVGK